MAKNDVVAISHETGEILGYDEEILRGGVDTNAVDSAISNLKNGTLDGYSSIKTESFEDKLKVVAALQNSTPLDETNGATIMLKDFIILKVMLAKDGKDSSGEKEIAPRCILITDDGQAFHATSQGILKALENFVVVLGEPAQWPAAIGVKRVEEKTRAGYKVTTLKVA